MDWKKESEMFDNAADYYDKYRPSYPQEIIDKLIEYTSIHSRSNLLEIGAGSGKATELFAHRGLNILCIEPGRNLVELGDGRFPNENFVFRASRFEDYDLAAEFYDVVFSAQAFHWIPQPVGYKKCAHTLKKNGYLALFWNMYITYDNEMDKELCALSDKYGGLADFLSEEGCERRISSIVSGIEESGWFSTPNVFRKIWVQDYTADEFYGFALTGNRFMQKDEKEKQAAYTDITKLAQKNGGIIRRPYLCVLYIAQKLNKTEE